MAIQLPHWWLVMGRKRGAREKVTWAEIMRKVNERRKLKGLPPAKAAAKPRARGRRG